MPAFYPSPPERLDVERIVLLGSGGDNLITARGRVPITLDGGAGNDTLVGGLARDTLLGRRGDDQLFARGGRIDLVDGGRGNDSAESGAEDVEIGVETDSVL